MFRVPCTTLFAHEQLSVVVVGRLLCIKLFSFSIGRGHRLWIWIVRIGFRSPIPSHLRLFLLECFPFDGALECSPNCWTSLVFPKLLSHLTSIYFALRSPPDLIGSVGIFGTMTLPSRNYANLVSNIAFECLRMMSVWFMPLNRSSRYFWLHN